jgi:hypothetical protein
MRDHKRVFGKTCAELDALAKEAVRRAVADLHAKGIPTYHMEGGKIIETAPGASWSAAGGREGMAPHEQRAVKSSYEVTALVTA